jgi:hypothetical protein
MTRLAAVLAVISLSCRSHELPADPGERAKLYLDTNAAGMTVPWGDGGAPHWEAFTYWWHKCRIHSEGLVCSACYQHPAHLYGQMDVLCPFTAHAPCRAINGADDGRYGVDPNQCFVR